jgi:aspartyl-tRNA(Asn)/glutamyl-tRNA(Gln) amidotransferase subunit C
MSMRLRDDVVSDGAQADAVLGNAPDREGAFFAVPKVVE